jgi:hypothetical protein
MNISNLGRLIGAGLLALGLHAIAPQASAQTLSGNDPLPAPGAAEGEQQRS